MTYEISPYLRAQFKNGELDALLSLPEGLGYALFHELLNKKGRHVTILGDSRSGKTEKGKYLDWWFSTFGETIILFDSGKPGDIECYFDNDDPKRKFNKNVQVLVPYEGGCKFEVEGVPKDIIVKITPVMDPVFYFDLIEKDWINIISVRNYFQDLGNLKRYLRKMLQNFSLRARKKEFRAWTPAVLKFEEAHEAVGSQSVSRDRESILLTMEIANMERQLASSGIRLETITQSYYDLPEPVRKNTHTFVVCRGAYAEKSHSRAINYLQGFAERAKEWQGWFVIHGRHYYSYAPVSFPLIGTPKNIQIYYDGYADGPQPESIEQYELLLDAGWRCQDFDRVVETQRSQSAIGDLPAVVEEKEELDVSWVNVWESKESADGVGEKA